MTASSARARRTVVAAAGLASLLVLTACSGGGSDPATSSATPSADASAASGLPLESGSAPGEAAPPRAPAPSGGAGTASARASGSASTQPSPDSAAGPTEAGSYLPVPDGIELTEQGALLALGTPATVAYRVQGDVATLKIRVDELERTTFARSFDGWKLDRRTRRTTPYFVRASVRNVGRTPLGGRRVPLLLLDSKQRLVRSSEFQGEFTPCPSRPFPRGFTRGARTDVCLVFLAPPGRAVSGVTFYPRRDFEAIIWAGDVDRAGQRGRGSGGRGGDDEQRRDGNNRGNG